MSVKIEDLVPEVAIVAQRCLNALVTMSIPHAVTSTLRTEAEQVALFAQGRQLLPTVNVLRGVAGLPPIGAAEKIPKRAYMSASTLHGSKAELFVHRFATMPETNP